MALAKTWYGTSGEDTFVFDDNYGVVDNVWAAGGDDRIADGRDDPWSSDFFHGQAGDDTIVSLSGYDLLSGGGGNDLIKVKSAQYNAGAIPGMPAGPEDWVGFDVEVKGGDGFDVLRVTNAEGYSVETEGDWTYITTRFGGTISAKDIEKFEFIL